jgi:hypothetical protein
MSNKAEDKRICTDNESGCLERTAMLYLDALLAADDTKVPLAPNVRRTHTLAIPRSSKEDRVVHNEAEIRASIRQEKLLFRHGLRVFVDESQRQVIAFWRTGTTFPGAQWVTCINRIHVTHGFIDEIEVTSIPRDSAPENPRASWPEA